ncbi:hypothetical protein CC85DRAFT_94418 [Cutaneotrichosporon oleaginosum]|uniref:Uncharacterized protein n=1 Tax=Cutaneotrichosporon oleaginosum TaxID=879819 RepID=A0A0J0XMF2_9TREE|nr:uncharacterized protein CC85DRAFT_94418 [Cutaneotrichosporon oleaginosum]KLT42257.1 hypothetical protein CC85DRAFT_94418 [Cutaneotrichosporon oleaginosum]TXT11429.1 hypothetical protein COLE_01839 [Cutaneotrichosporon oleaginosum]
MLLEPAFKTRRLHTVVSLLHRRAKEIWRDAKKNTKTLRLWDADDTASGSWRGLGQVERGAALNPRILCVGIIRWEGWSPMGNVAEWLTRLTRIWNIFQELRSISFGSVCSNQAVVVFGRVLVALCGGCLAHCYFHRARHCSRSLAVPAWH